MSQPVYDRIVDHCRELGYLKATMALLEWDQQTMLPAKGGEYRAQQLTSLAGMIHERETDSAYGDALAERSQDSLFITADTNEAANVRELKRQFEKKNRLSRELVEALANACAIGQQVWVEARKQKDFSRFASRLETIISLKREEADAIGHDGCRYDALLDEYEPGAKTSEVEATLDGLRQELVPLVQKIQDSKTRPDASIVNRKFPIEKQKQHGRLAANAIGFDFERGRIDVTAHPFCTTLGPSDIRLTTRYDENHFNGAFFGTLHEAGHGIYEQGLCTDDFGLPTGSYCSLGIHESQSRMWENLVGRSFGFWKHFYSQTQSLYSESLKDVSLEQFVAAINHSSPSLIRVEADEATYDLHIIIRFELEKALLDGELQVADLPGAWNEKYEKYLGIVPENDAEGVLQDVHWSAGLVGYFPTYSLGNIYASQFFAIANEELGDLEKQFEQGDFTTLKQWLNAKIHAPGGRYRSSELVSMVSGREASHRDLVRHLNEKFGKIYMLAD